MHHEAWPDVEAALRGALAGWTIAPDAPLELLAISENVTCLAEDRDGRRIVLRVHRPGYHTAEEILSELSWIEALRRGGLVRTAEPLRRTDGSPLGFLSCAGIRRAVSAFEFLPGAEPRPDAALVPLFRRLGATSARLHGQARIWIRPAGFVRKTWDHAAMFGARPVWGDWRGATGFDASGRATVSRALERAGERLSAFGKAPERFGLIHADLRLANLLVVDAPSAGEPPLAVIDFDDCGFGWFLYDFAAAVSFIEDDPLVPDLQAAWLAGYREIAPLSPDEEAMLPVFVILRRVLLTAWIASRRGSPVADGFGAPFTEGTIALAERFLSAQRRAA